MMAWSGRFQQPDFSRLSMCERAAKRFVLKSTARQGDPAAARTDEIDAHHDQHGGEDDDGVDGRQPLVRERQ